MTDEPLPLPEADREIDDAVERLFRQHANETNPVGKGSMFAFEQAKDDVSALSGDPLMRLEQKIDAVMSTMTSLKSRIDSIDTVLARLIHRR